MCADRVGAYWAVPEDQPDSSCRSGPEIEAPSCVEQHMKQFPDDARLSSWAGICPGNNESAGTHKSRHTTHGNPWFRELLIECAWSASRKKESAFQVRYNRLKPKIGHKRALVAVAHALTKAIYHVLATSQPYREEQPELLNEVQAPAHNPPSHQTPPSARLLAHNREADSAARMVRFSLLRPSKRSLKSEALSQSTRMPRSEQTIVFRTTPILRLGDGDDSPI